MTDSFAKKDAASLNDPKFNGEEFQKGLNLLVFTKMGDYQAVQDLLDEGVPVNFVGDQGIRALHVAAANHQEEIGLLLLERGADVHALDTQYRCNAAHYAATSNCCVLLEKLSEKGLDFSVSNRFDATPMHLVGDREACETLQKLGQDLDITNDAGRRPIHVACRDQREGAALYLIEHSKYINHKDSEGNTPLHFAALSGSLAVVKALVAKGAMISAQNKQGQTPLHLAADRGHDGVSRYLLSKGADPLIADVSGKRPKVENIDSSSSKSFDEGNSWEIAKKDGYLTKEGGNIKSWKRRFFIMQGKSLSYYKSPPKIGESPIGIIDLSTCLSVRSGMRKDKKVISVETPGRTYYLHADNFTEQDSWLEAIEKQVEMIKNRR